MAKSRKDRDAPGADTPIAAPDKAPPPAQTRTAPVKTAAQPAQPARPADTKAAPPSAPDEAARAANLAELAFDRRRHGDVERELAQLSPAEARLFLRLIEVSMRKRRIQLAGYLLSVVIVVLATLCALYLYALETPGLYIAWSALGALALVGVTLWAFGRWAHRPERPPPHRRDPDTAPPAQGP